jgi:uncharacterized membrane protein
MPATRASGRPRPISIARRPLTALLLPVPIVCFIGVLLTDIAYLNSAGNLVWLDFSSWLLLAGLIFGAIAAVLLLIDTVRSSVSWAALVALISAWLVELLSMFVHQRDGWTAVAGLGLILSVLGAILILIAGWVRRPPAVEAMR